MLINGFSFSPSQWGQFESCPRQYWFSRYGSWGGWEKNAPELTREIYRLKKLSNRYLWSGSRVHEAISSCLKQFQQGGTIDQMLEKERLLTLLRQDFRQSRELPEGVIPPKGTYRFVEHDDKKMAVSDQVWKEIADRSLEAFGNFFQSAPWGWIQESGPECLLRTDEELEQIPFKTDGVEFPVYLSIDLAIETPEGLIILDWKTGKPSPKSHQEQLDLYAYYAFSQMDLPPSGIRTAAVYLSAPDRKVVLREATEKSMEETYLRIESQTRVILQKIRDPLKGMAEKEQFPAAPAAYSCKSCVYSRVCEDSLL